MQLLKKIRPYKILKMKKLSAEPLSCMTKALELTHCIYFATRR